ncbi:hypothetical protein H4R33_003781 [Dimargaris cristalligena]|nr:hypothetical protein H4R33_003781 [Dimargaris cristalligena]
MKVEHISGEVKLLKVGDWVILTRRMMRERTYRGQVERFDFKENRMYLKQEGGGEINTNPKSVLFEYYVPDERYTNNP